MIIILLFSLPVILQLSLSPLWFLLENCGTLSFIVTIINSVVSPLYFWVIIARKKNDSFSKVFTSFLISFGICIMCSFLRYCNWGISTGYLFTPDSLTIFILKVEVVMAGSILALGLITCSKR